MSTLIPEARRERQAVPVALSPASIESTLQQLFDAAPLLTLSSRDRIVVFSDLHLATAARGTIFVATRIS